MLKNTYTRLAEVKDSDYMTAEEASVELDVKVSAIRNYLYDGKIPFYKFKTLTLISKKDVDAWKSRQKQFWLGRK